ncbi:hypothetical protein DRV85_18775 [Rhodosalinus halophilus]|uniref:Methyltransferase FkbM domain-containing protein n=2 Tax=Rhodosalinus halophilus TaxID=2259333 RepID=A0A365U4A6_9RHOB|nr:hypothetical protein DRV85_18775 [Rhodosalinus halophilus]
MECIMSALNGAKLRSFAEFTAHISSLGFRPKTVIDVGVAWGTEELYGPFSGAFFVLVEALPYFEPEIRKITSRIGGEYHVKAVGERPAQRRIAVRDNPMSLAGINVLDGGRKGDLEYDIEIVRIDDLLGGRSFEQPALLKLDVQGGDLRALRGAPQVLAQMEMVIVEASLFNPDNLVYDIMAYMRSAGFELYEIFGASYRPRDDALGQVDLAFVRDGSFLRSEKNWM